MLFNIEADRGSQIVGYIVPDDYSATPTLRVIDARGEIATFLCPEDRPSLVIAGRHATGRCGFTIDDSIVPDLAHNDSVELYDADTGLLIYRRRHGAQVAHQRIFRLETHLFPLWRMDNAVEHKFQFFHKGIERFGRETASQVFLLSDATSMYVSGRLAYKAYESYVQEVFKCIMIMHEPYQELAERLLTLKHVKSFGDELLGARDMVTFDAAIDFAQGIEIDEVGLRRAFDAMPKPVISMLTNPVTRQLAADSFDSPPPKGAIASALDVLASFAVVGIREYQDIFLEDLEALIEMPGGALPPVPQFSAVDELASLLRRVPESEMLLEQDLELYFTVKDALEGSLVLNA